MPIVAKAWIILIDVSIELEKLQDKLPPFDLTVAKNILRREIGEENYSQISNISEPIAAASVAQVHSATLKDGRKFIIKVIRPGIESLIRKDLDLLHLLAKKA